MQFRGLITAGTVCFMTTTGAVLAQATGVAPIPGLPDSMPTTVSGAAIVVVMSMVGGYWYIIRRLFETVEKMQQTFSIAIDKMVEERKLDREASAERHANMQKMMMTLANQNARLRSRQQATEDTDDS